MKRTRLSVLLIGALCLLIAIGAISLMRSARAQQPQHTEVKIDPKLFDQFVGKYAFADNPDAIFSFYREGDRFFMRPSNQTGIEIFPESESKFFLKIQESDITFVRDAQGKTTGLLWHQGSNQRSMNKIGDQPLADTTVAFERREEMIPMRDGVRLRTLVFTPRNQTGKLADNSQSHTVRHWSGRLARNQWTLQRLGARCVYLRASGYPRSLWFRRTVHDESTAARSQRSEIDR